MRRLGCVFANILCPTHLNATADFEQSATPEEIFSFMESEPADDELKAFVEKILPLIKRMTLTRDVDLQDVQNFLEV